MVKKRNTKRTPSKKQKSSSDSEGALTAVWNWFIDFLKSYVPDDPNEHVKKKRGRPAKKKKYIASKRT
jgi:transposase